uniref:glycosyltransferase BC10-like n=1 Tax=Erigeron canadensis TaxID=72917 RepID=UPI001CB9793D|nr:glycosyltransferase BC10-like [Erigeron canadensis]
MYPSPLSLLCALLLTLPLAIVFTITTDLTTVYPPHFTGHSQNHISSLPIKTKLRKLVKKPLHFNSPPYRPPQPLPAKSTDDHEEDDENELFQLAGGSSTEMLPASAQKKIAFMFLTTGPLPMAPLWERYFNRTKRKNLYNIYIHADPNLQYDLIFQGVFTNRTIPSKPTRRHTPTLIAAHRRLLAHALLHDPLNYMFALISPSCIPIHSFDFTYKTLMKSNKSFIEILENEPGAWGRWAARGDSVMLPQVPYEKFRIGSQFSVLTRQHAKVAVNDTWIWSKFKLPCLKENIYRCYPEENYLPTLMSMVDKMGCVAATLTYVDWKGRHDGHPITFRATDVRPDLIKMIRNQRPRYGDEEKRNDPFLFARKFGSDTVGALLDIFDDIILKD